MRVEYDRNWTDDVAVGKTQIRYGLTTEYRVPVRFLVQLEYWNAGKWYEFGNRGEWLTVARFDHNADADDYHNVERYGLHVDVYDPSGEKRLVKHDFASVPIRYAMQEAERYLTTEYHRLVQRFEGWM